MTTMTRGLEVSDLSFRYRLDPVLKDLSFQSPGGRAVGVLGANGAGKSTLFKLILGILPLQQGRIMVNGSSLPELSIRKRAREMAYIPQTQPGDFQFSVSELVLMGTTASFGVFSQPGRKEKQRAAQALRLLKIEKFADRRFDQLSGGEQQLALIARAVAQDAPLLIMDEPCASLDYGNQIRVLEQIRELADRGYLVLFSTHNPQHVFLYADDVLLISGQTAYAYGPPHHVLSESLLSHVYGIPIRLEESAQTGDVTVLPDFVRIRKPNS
ncbi:MAG TPA: ABC transporter ATP-binding protein [Bacillota bacterium]|jgi:iron complex transport system ATP-binding protein|nr:ABC transporter ATP-binding protein [Bacillota bacterium]HQB80568.1 ABC transporter ATP-binding protein [Bacillota bacterium]